MPPTRQMGFFTSWLILVFPMLLSMTIAAAHPLYLSFLLLMPTALVLRYPKMEMGTPLPSSQPASPAAQIRMPAGAFLREGGSEGKLKARLPPLPALTTYRAHMMLMTVLAILAVDFPVFPRSLAKCETFGMDLGVGSFVFSQGIVSAIPLVKDASYLQSAFLPKLLKVTRKSLPIIALGLVRVLLIKGTEYPEHVTEYGVHWNFFVTLALLPVLQVFLHPLLVRLPISMVGVLVGIVQQVALSHPRTSLVSANKEGLVSLLGYLSIQLLGLSAGTLILPPSPSYFRRQAVSEADWTSPRQLDKTATELCAYAILWWSLLGLARLARVDGRWSRGKVNVSYILWIAAFNDSFILLYLVILDLWIFGRATPPTSSEARHHKRKMSDLRSKAAEAEGSGTTAAAYFGLSTAANDARQVQTRRDVGNPPVLLEVMNRYGLVVFLLANVLTGLINLTMSTMYMSDGAAMLVLSVYSLICCAVPWVWSRWMTDRIAKVKYS
ncbi:GWT1-domain-containing protein [Gymnopilus junonius]|uniref:GPI-anchored wall transfer protein n=1 Tax=Gymnopilus junonius TaxID=109634 RepID=A0A9P5N9L0_GYMJU|nr:GWT1-domain-containing protein [Gymnopilus junonius]